LFVSRKTQRLQSVSLREIEGAFAYPLLLENGATLRKVLQQKRIYIPTLWPNVLSDMPRDSTEYKFAADILPLPCDQRYNKQDILFIIKLIEEEMK
jgi:hypothetical protein